MNVHTPGSLRPDSADGIVPAENYISVEFAKREAEGSVVARLADGVP
ncbi:MAG: hypothetical protein JOY99_05560 [Sphingomonadaceae bacterium]|nr:hypothetical protein [Sphingomonadaceae bacterium]